MSNIAIRVENLSKRYKIGVAKQRHDTLRDEIMGALSSIFRSNGHGGAHGSDPADTIWALKDVSFEVKHGEVVGFIGRNGAGKTTLLKILSRITEPTSGRVEIYGRVGSLLEVGTGFHAELTGRENIYLNGAILGMKKSEIDKKFDDIVGFSEIEKFIDTPVKRYSSGMYVRLAFAVAAHLEPEILIVDEVLAVGDAAFQKKCLGKIGDVARQGRTVLFVSHNTAAVLSLCQKGVQLDSGMVVCAGPVEDVVKSYVASMDVLDVLPLNQRRDRSGDGSARVVAMKIECTDRGKMIYSTSRLKVTLDYECETELKHPTFLVSVNDPVSSGIFLLSSEAVDGFPTVLPCKGRVVCLTDAINLTPGRCFVNVALLKNGVMADYIQEAAYFDVEVDNVSRVGKVPARSWVLCVIKQEWSTKELDRGDELDSY
jgi:lipopolysaccharide transport system ATP-binding protein